MAERNVFLISADRETFDRTVATQVDLSDQSDVPEPISGRETVRLGGLEDSDRNRSTFERMTEGDLLLFYVDDRYVATGRVGEAFEDDSFAEAIWDGVDATFLYEIESYTPVDVSKAAGNRVFGYDSGYTPNTMRVAEDRVDRQVESIERAMQQYEEQ